MSEHPNPAAPDFDPWRCQWCGDTGFDLEGLAHHVWLSCGVVERLAQANIEAVRLHHEECHALLVTRKGDAS